MNFFDIRIIYTFIFLQPVLDLFTSWMSRYMSIPITIGVLARSIFMGYMFIYVLFINRPKEKIYKIFRAILIMTFIYVVIFIGYNFATKELRFVISEMKGIIKVYYFPIVLIGLFVFNKTEKINISNKFLNNLLLVYTSIIVIATLTGTYYRSYNDYIYSLGSIGWFFSANETGSLIAILMPFTIVNYIQNKVNITNILSILFCILVSLYIGTKVPFLAFIGSVAIIFVFTFIKAIVYKEFKNKEIKKGLVSLIGMTLVFCILFYKSPIYQNIQFNYGPMIHNMITSIKDKFNIREEHDIALDNNIVLDNNKELVDEEVMDPEMGGQTDTIIPVNPHVNQEDALNAILSNRDAFLTEVKNRYNNGTVMEKLIGLGHIIINIKDGVNTDKTIELDFQDIIYRQGIIGSILYFVPFIIILCMILFKVIKKPKKIMNINIFATIISLILGLGIAGISGHVLTAPGVSIFVILPIIMLYNKLNYGEDKNEDFNSNANI